MNYKAFYRTYRPTSFDEVVGQDHIVKTLVNLIKMDKIFHGYLFSGPRGTGKTSIAKIFANATIDINANICRMVIDILANLKDENFAEIYTSQMYSFMNDAFKQLDSFIFRDKKYTINKQLFKLYWCLEGLNVFFDFLDEENLYPVLKRCSEITEYTIREKVALVLCNDIKTKELLELKQKLKSDDNYYVRNLF